MRATIRTRQVQIKKAGAAAADRADYYQHRVNKNEGITAKMAGVFCFEVRDSGIVGMPTTAASLNDLSLSLPQGVYTTFRTYPGQRVLRMEAHLDRLVESAAIEGHALALDRAALRRAIAGAVAQSGFALARIRLTVGLSPAPTVFVSLDELHDIPKEVYETGVRCGLAERALRREAPRSKSTRFIGPATAARDAESDVNEVLLVDDQLDILEGSSSNFFAILDGTLRTADDGVLAGVTRGIVLDAAAGLLPLDLRPVRVPDIPRLQEAFITSVSRAVLPVVEIDRHRLGDGRPGEITLELTRRFDAALERELEPISLD
jgi:branched-chain amino acid aminotransferase